MNNTGDFGDIGWILSTWICPLSCCYHKHLSTAHTHMRTHTHTRTHAHSHTHTHTCKQLQSKLEGEHIRLQKRYIAVSVTTRFTILPVYTVESQCVNALHHGHHAQ